MDLFAHVEQMLLLARCHVKPIVINLFGQDRPTKASLRGQRKKAPPGDDCHGIQSCLTAGNLRRAKAASD